MKHNKTKIMTLIKPQHAIVSFDQIQFKYNNVTIRGSDWGRLSVDRKKLARKFGHGAFYINVIYPDGKNGALWLVDNLYIPAAPSNTRHQTKFVTAHIDLRPNEEGRQGTINTLDAVVVLSKNILPVSTEIMDYVQKQTSSNDFEVNEFISNAQGDLGDSENPSQSPNDTLSISEPPPPVYVPTQSGLGFAAPIAVYQDAFPNIQSAINQCAPMAHANTLKYLENQFNTLPLMWDLPEATIPGIGRVGSYDDVLFWQPIPQNSVIAQIDAKTMRNGVLDEDSGSGSSTCQNMRGVMAYLNQNNLHAEFSHQGRGDEYGYGSTCDSAAGANVGEFLSSNEGENPTWEWIFDQLSKGYGLSIAFGRYDSTGNRTSGHMLRVWGASQINDTRYLHLLDDGQQGSNQSGLQLLQYRVEDTGTPGDPGTPDGRLNINGTTSEIEFAISIKARPTLAVL
ncbi:MAG: hypothetical protein ACJAVV_002408 [Alphaproteobacteria bacterium]|jgi:hypothetical protein